MTITHAPSAVTLRADLANAELQFENLQRKLAEAQREVNDVGRSGQAVLAALEATMVPIMAELAVTRSACKEYCARTGEPFTLAPASSGSDHDRSNSIAAMEAEIKHLELDIAHYQQKAEHMQIEERQRSHEISRLYGELSEAYEHLDYEQQCVKHHEECRQVGIAASATGWAGMGPCGLGRRTQEVRAEKKLRECAEQRGGRLARDVTKLASDTSQQQASIAQLGRRLKGVRKSLQEKEKSLANAEKVTKLLHVKLKVIDDANNGNANTENPEVEGLVDGLASSSTSSSKKKKAGLASSTGKLPHLSF
jgi:hypothetical protein